MFVQMAIRASHGGRGETGTHPVRGSLSQRSPETTVPHQAEAPFGEPVRPPFHQESVLAVGHDFRNASTAPATTGVPQAMASRSGACAGDAIRHDAWSPTTVPWRREGSQVTWSWPSAYLPHASNMATWAIVK